MASKVEIYNLALTRLGAKEISDPDEASKSARSMNSVYDVLRGVVLRDYPWEFAKARANLALDAETPAFEYSYQHELPTDFRRLVSLYDWPDDSTWVLEGTKILSNSDTVKIIYIKEMSDPGEFADDFVNTLALKMAASTAYKMTGDKDLADRLRGEYTAIVSMAKFISSAESENKSMEAEDWVNARV